MNLLDRHGVRFLGGWGIPEEKAPVLVEKLDRIRAEFLAAGIPSSPDTMTPFGTG